MPLRFEGADRVRARLRRLAAPSLGRRLIVRSVRASGEDARDAAVERRVGRAVRVLRRRLRTEGERELRRLVR